MFCLKTSTGTWLHLEWNSEFIPGSLRAGLAGSEELWLFSWTALPQSFNSSPLTSILYHEGGERISPIGLCGFPLWNALSQTFVWLVVSHLVLTSIVTYFISFLTMWSRIAPCPNPLLCFTFLDGTDPFPHILIYLFSVCRLFVLTRPQTVGEQNHIHFSLLYPCCLEQCPAHSKDSKNICWIHKLPWSELIFPFFVLLLSFVPTTLI